MLTPLSPFSDVFTVMPPRYTDHRGFFSETYNANALAQAGLVATFVQDNLSCSTQAGTIRGLHFQKPPAAQGKLVSVVRGRIWDVVVDIRQDSATYGRWAAVELGFENWLQLYVPEGFAHGFCTLEPDTMVAYKVTAPYSPTLEGGIRWDDPALAIPWPVEPGQAILSEKDAMLPLLKDLKPTWQQQEAIA